MRVLAGVIFIVAGLFAFQNCGRYKAISGQQSDELGLGSESSSAVDPTAGQMKQCQFISPDYFTNIFKTQLGLTQAPVGDVSILDVNGKPTSDQYIQRYAIALGQGNVSEAILDDRVCTPLKMKLGIQIMMEGCFVALQNSATKAKLFPNGTGDYEMLFLTFLGRSPQVEEVQVLNDLVKTVSSSKAAEALCSAVLGSLESLDRS